MDEREAQELIRMVEANWGFDLGANGRELWRDGLLPFDPALATRAIAKMATHPLSSGRYRPAFSDLREILVAMARHEVEENAWRELPPEPVGKPEWVSRWERARDAGDMRVFPEQVPGYLDLQKDHPLNVLGYALPSTPTTDEKDWVQPHEYADSPDPEKS